MDRLNTSIRLLGFIVAACAMAGSNAAVAQQPSLWQRRDSRMVNLVSDVKARKIGDLLFVTINEQSDIENRDQRLMIKQNSATSEQTGNYGFAGNLGSASGGLNFDQDSAASRNFNGNTQYRSEREFIDRFAVTVMDVFPNGNLLISGTRNVLLEGDNRKLILTGIVRSTDLDINNTVSSRFISNLVIEYEADRQASAEGKFINQGWLGKKFNSWWPY
jgi:flagellar L-ring protein precursor FlgH